MKVLFILELYYPNIGGIEKLFKSLAEKLAGDGHDVRVITTRFRSDLARQEVINGVKVRRLNISSRFLFTFFGIFGMLGAARECDIIHTTSFNAAFPARLAGWLSGKKVVITFHEAWGRLWFSLPFAGFIVKRLYYSYEWFVLRLGFHRYIAVSGHTAESLQKLGVKKDRIVRIYNGLDYSEYADDRWMSPKGFTYTYFGRLGISKGIDHILNASQGFLEEHPGAHLKMIFPRIPAGLYRKVMRKLQKLPKKQVTLFHDLPYEKLKKELLASSCIVIPSYSEGFCFAAAESAAMGIPVISSGKGALEEVVSGKHLLMETFDAEGLHNALEKAYNNEWHEIPLKEFPFSDTIHSYLELYRELGAPRSG